ncbi:MAG TPA: FRG domain-containing protein [Blastocatellia bacterium]|nr:FRG domain-containing protein [Blastocatellia bacterium]
MELNKWEDFRQTVSELKALGDFIWRGQRKAWPLTSSIDRDSAYDDPKTRDNLLNVHRENFKKGMNDSHPGIELGDENHIWALGQHYGLRTPLLDWTKCPHTAAYFAFERLKTTRDDTHRFVYALNETVRRLIRKKKGTDSFRYIDLIKRSNIRVIGLQSKREFSLGRSMGMTSREASVSTQGEDRVS